MAERPKNDVGVGEMIKRHKQLTRRRTSLDRELTRLRIVFEEEVGLGLRQCLKDATRYIPALLENPPIYPNRHGLELLLRGRLAVERDLCELTKRLQDAGVHVVGEPSNERR